MDNGNSHFTESDRTVLNETHKKTEHIPVEVADYVTDRLNEFTLQLSDHIAQNIQGAVKITVNGKIDNLTKIVEAHILASKPSMTFISDIQSANKVLQYIAKMVGVFGAIGTAIWAALHFFKNQ